MEFSHELVLPNEDLPFRMFYLKEKTEIMSGKSTGTGRSRCLLYWKESWIFISMKKISI